MVSDKQLHGLFVLFFVAISIFLTLGRVGTAFDSFALLTPDLGVYASIAVGQDQPDLFPGDPFISNEKNINSYNMVYVPLIRALKNSFGNYGTACAFLLPFFIFIHLIGYYVLGISIFKNPWATSCNRPARERRTSVPSSAKNLVPIARAQRDTFVLWR